MILNEYGKIAEKEILKSREIRKEIKIDCFVIMPNHLHLLIIIENINNVGCDCIAPINAPNNDGIIQINERIQNNGTRKNNGTMQSFPTEKENTHFFDEH